MAGIAASLIVAVVFSGAWFGLIVLLDMASHPGLRERRIPFVIMANKQD